MTIFVETKRLLIKIPSLVDLDNWYILHSDLEVMQFMGGPRSKKEISEWLESDISHYKKHGFSMGSVFEKTSNEFIGRAGLVYLDHDDKQPNIEIGYVLHKRFWNKGYGTELVVALIDWGFAHITDHLVAVTRPDNKKSQRVLEKCEMHYLKKISLHDEIFWMYEISK